MNLQAEGKDPPASVHLQKVSGTGPVASAFRAIYEAELPLVLRLLRRLGVADRMIEDAAQEVFVVVFKKQHTHDPDTPWRPWVCAIATRVAGDFRKRAHVRREGLGEDAPERGLEDRIPAHASRLEARHLLQRALSAIPEAEREAVVLVDLEGFRVTELAVALDVPEGTLHARLHHGRRKLADEARRLMETPHGNT